MPDKEKKSEFTVTDRRLFSSEGELRPDVVEAEERRAEREAQKRESQQRANDERTAQRQADTVEAVKDPKPEPLPHARLSRAAQPQTSSMPQPRPTSSRPAKSTRRFGRSSTSTDRAIARRTSK